MQAVMKLNTKYLYNHVPTFLLGLDVVAVILMYALLVAYVPTLNGDNIEHIHSSFLVASGEVPYRDFFQHHNPLLWYLFAPIVKIFAYNATIAEITCFISFLVFLKSLVYIYHISSEFLTDKMWSLLTVAFVALPGYKLFALDFRPDNFMVCCLMGGIYYYFLYLKEKKTFNLAVAFIWFVVSFLFAQKALFPLFILGLSGLYFWAKKEIKTKDLLVALIVPVIIGGGCLYYLHYYDMAELYFLSNYDFNLELASRFERTRIADYAPFMFSLIVLGIIGSIASIKFKNKYLTVLAVLCLAEYIQRRCYFSPYSYYYWLLLYFCAFCGVSFLYHVNQKYKFVIWIGVIWVWIVLVNVVLFQYDYASKFKNRPYLPDYITRNINQCDYVFNGDGMMYNLFGRDPSYYWQLIGQLDVVGEDIGIHKKPNINELILTLKPKIVYGKSYYNKFAFEQKKVEVVHFVDKDILNKYYQSTPFDSVYILKDEYNNRECVNNGSGHWYYIN